MTARKRPRPECRDAAGWTWGSVARARQADVDADAARLLKEGLDRALATAINRRHVRRLPLRHESATHAVVVARPSPDASIGPGIDDLVAGRVRIHQPSDAPEAVVELAREAA